MTNQRRLGAEQEQRAVAYLKAEGMQIVVRNFRCRQGEIDIIGRGNGFLVFVEVKYRRGTGAGAPEEAVGYYKQKKICCCADVYRTIHGIGDGTAIRYDVVAIAGERITWYRNAFEHMG